VLVARDEARGRVSACGYLVDVYCLGVKNVVGPRVMDRHGLFEFARSYFSAYEGQSLAASLELAQHLVCGAVEYARSLGFEPHEDFAATWGMSACGRVPASTLVSDARASRCSSRVPTTMRPVS
jgi:hypothetical protein